MDRNASEYDREETPDYVPGSDSGRSSDVAREDREAYLRRVQQNQAGGSFSRIARVATLGLGAYALGRTIPKDVWVEGLHKLGQFGKSTFGEFIRARNETFLNAVDPALAAKYASRSRGGSVELSQVLEEEVRPFLNELNQSSADMGARQRAMLKTREALQSRFGRSINTDKYTGITVGDLARLQDTYNNRFDVISRDAYTRIMDMRQTLNPDGGWFDKLVIDRHLYTAEYGKVGQAIRSNSIRDLRWASRRALGEAAHNGLGFQIPFIGFRPVELLAPFFRHFASEDPLFIPLAQKQKLAQNISTPGSGLNYLIGNRAMNFGPEGFKAIGEGRFFTGRKMDSLGRANTARLGMSPQQNLPDPTNKKSFAYFSAKAQEWLGFGTRYRTQDQVFSGIVQANRRASGLKSGQYKYTFYENIRAGDLPFMARLRHQSETIAAGKTYNPNYIVPNPYKGKTFQDLPKVQQFAAYMESDVGNLGSPRLGQFTKRNTVPPKGHALGMPKQEFSVYENTLGTKLFNVAHHLTNRLNDLMGATAGVGFKPTAGNWGFLYNAVKISFLGATLNPFGGYAVDAFKYVDYLFKRVTSGFGYTPWEGVGPSDLTIKLYEGTTLAMAALKDATGATGISKYSEDLMPGTANSPLSGLIRTAAPAYLLGSKFGTRGMYAGLALGGLLGGGISDFFGTPLLGARSTDSASDLLGYYSGDKMVAVMKGRWWGLGRTNFQGEAIDRYEPHWVKMLKSGYEYTSALYGSEREYFEQASILPTPHNLFGFGKDEDYYAEKHYQQRPYQVSPSGRQMHQGEILPEPTNIPRGLTPDMLERLGMGPVNESYPGATSAESLSYRAKDTLNDITEFAGIYKFFWKTAFGDNSSGPIISSAADITSPNRLYWDKDIGGMLGMTELLRRYVIAPDDLNPLAKINNVPNQMPSFLPGRRSAFEEDRDYYIDFTVGDPFAKVKGGEYRLPGAGYEATHELFSGQKGVYTDIDAFMILADVAPYSAAYKFYKRKANAMLKDNELGAEWASKVQETMQQREERALGYAYSFSKRRFTRSTSQIASLNDQTNYNAVERMVGGAYERLTLDVLPHVGRAVPFGTLITHKLFPHHTAEEDYYERQVMAARFSNWSNPWEGFIRPKLGILYNENPLTATAGGLTMGLMATTPIGMISAGVAGGAALGAGSLLSNTTGLRYKPGFREDEESQLEYFDKLEFLRYQNAINIAKNQGDQDLVKSLRGLQSSKTMAGLNLMQPMRLKFAGMSAIPKPERYYFDAFSNAAPEDRDRILDMAPSYMGDIYKSMWEPGSVRRDNNQAVRDYFDSHPVPQQNWPGWNLGMEKWQVMAKVNETPVNGVAIDMNRQHISTLMLRQNSMFAPNMQIESSIANSLGQGDYINEALKWGETAREQIAITKQAIRDGFTNVRVRPRLESSTDTNPRYNIRHKRENREFVR